MNVLGSIKSKGHYLSGKLFYKQGESIFLRHTHTYYMVCWL